MRRPQASVPRPDRRVLKQRLTRGLLLIQARGGRGTVVIIGMQVEPAVAEACVTLQQPGVHRAFSRGSCPWITGAWQWRAAQAPRGVVGIVTCACTQDFGGCRSSLSVSCPSLWSELIAMARAYPVNLV